MRQVDSFDERDGSADDSARGRHRADGLTIGAVSVAERRGNLVGRDVVNKSSRTSKTHAVSSANYVTIALAAAVTGYSEKAIRRKIEAGVWLEGREYVRAPDGHVLINMVGYHAWVAQVQV